jgi:hypothetical protein
MTPSLSARDAIAGVRRYAARGPVEADLPQARGSCATSDVPDRKAN